MVRDINCGRLRLSLCGLTADWEEGLCGGEGTKAAALFSCGAMLSLPG